jgi:hypothetical protein
MRRSGPPWGAVSSAASAASSTRSPTRSGWPRTRSRWSTRPSGRTAGSPAATGAAVTTVNPAAQPGTSQQAVVEAALVLLERMGRRSPVDQAAGDQAPVPPKDRPAGTRRRDHTDAAGRTTAPRRRSTRNAQPEPDETRLIARRLAAAGTPVSRRTLRSNGATGSNAHPLSEPQARRGGISSGEPFPCCPARASGWPGGYRSSRPRITPKRGRFIYGTTPSLPVISRSGQDQHQTEGSGQ